MGIKETVESSLPEESQNCFIDYIGASGEAKHESIKTPNDAKRILKTVIQNEEKQIPETSYQIRNFLLRSSAGEIDSVQAFTKNPDFVDKYNPYSSEVLDYIQNPNNWVAERKILHEAIIKIKMEKGLKLSRQIYEADPKIYVPTIFILRGNIASGKTTALRKHSHFERMRNGLDGVISPDDYKKTLKNAKVGDNKPLTDMQVHQESLFLSGEIQDRIMNLDQEKPSLVIDKRFAWQDEINKILKLAEDRSRKVDIFDLDAPLELSLIRVLSRDFPCPTFDTLIDGFERIRIYRRRLVEEAHKNENISYYILVDTGTGSKTENYLDVAKVIGQNIDIIDEDRFDLLAPEMPEDRIDWEMEIEKGKQKGEAQMKSYAIDKEYIKRAQRKYSLSTAEIKALGKYTGMTPVEAMNKHAGPKIDFS